MECEKFLVEYGLYDKQKIGYEDFADIDKRSRISKGNIRKKNRGLGILP